MPTNRTTIIEIERLLNQVWDLKATMQDQEKLLPIGTTQEVYAYCLTRVEEVLKMLEAESATLSRWQEEV